ncbi:transposase, partial [Caballeronia sp. M23-90]
SGRAFPCDLVEELHDVGTFDRGLAGVMRLPATALQALGPGGTGFRRQPADASRQQDHDQTSRRRAVPRPDRTGKHARPDDGGGPRHASIHHNIDQETIDRWFLEHRMVLFYLPPYSPELNRIETLWKHAKYHWRRFVTWTKETIDAEIENLLGGYGSKFEIRFS